MGEQRFREVASFPWGCPASSRHACPGARSVPAHSGRPDGSLTGLTVTCLRSQRPREHRGHHGKALNKGTPPPPRPGVSGQSQRRVPCASGNPLLPRTAAQLCTLPPQQAVGSPFTQSRAGNNPRRRRLPAKAKVRPRSSVFHSGSKALGTRCSPGHGMLWNGKERVRAVPPAP